MRRHFSRRCAVVACALAVAFSGRLAAQTTPEGFVTEWLNFGPLLQQFGNAPTAAEMALDYLADGVEYFESTIVPEDGLEVEPDFLGASASDGFTLFDPISAWQFVDLLGADTFDVVGQFGTADNSVVYGVFYINNPGDTAIEANVDLGSDDSVLVKLDDCVVFSRTVPRGCGGPLVIQDSAPVTISPGAHRVMIKVFNGGGGFCYRLRFSDRETGEGLTPDSDPPLEISTVPDDFDLTAIDPVGVVVERSIDPEILARLGEDSTVNVALSIATTFGELPDDTAVVVTETLSAGLTLNDGATPAPTSNVDGVVTWELTAGSAVDGINYSVDVAEPGEHTISGSFEVGAGGSCVSDISGASDILALNLEGILLGDLIGNGLGTAGSEPPEFAGINIDTGLFMTLEEVAGNHGNTMDTDGINPAPVDESDLIDSVFFIADETVSPDLQIISTAEVEYQFIAGDAHSVSWNGILSNATHDIDKGVGNIFVGGQGGIATGVGVHASAGVTYDLVGMRAEYGDDAIGIITGTVGMDTCGGSVNNYIIFSDEDGVIGDPLIQPATANTGQDLALEVPDEAMFMTFAAGDAGNGIGCDHGVFGDMRVLPKDASLVSNAVCAYNDAGNVVVDWDRFGGVGDPGQIIVNGEGVGVADAEATSFEIPLAELGDGIAEVCVANTKSESCCTIFGGGELHINCGGPRLEDFVDGRTWESDTNADPSPFLVSGSNVATWSGGFNPAFRTANTELVEPDFIDDPDRSQLFATERWADGDVRYTIPVPSGSYEVTLLFAEGCCSDGCEDLDDPALSLGGCRVFDILVNDDLVADQFSQHVEASRGIGNALPNAEWGIAVAVGPIELTDVNVIDIVIQDLGGGNPPENASIKGISIKPAGPGGGSQLQTGDTNGDGAFNISDPVAGLNFLFAGGVLPACYVVPDSNPVQLTEAGRLVNDFNGDGGVNIADMVGGLNRLFAGGNPHALGAGCIEVAGSCADNCTN